MPVVKLTHRLINGSAALLLLPGASALAQPIANGGTSGDTTEILVTARKREETLISVPVVVSAITGDRLAREGISNLDTIARIVPASTVRLSKIPNLAG